MKCHKCQKEMTMTPVCCECGIIPIAEGSFRQREDTIRQAAEIIRRYVTETPLGNQPHMIAHVAEAWLAANDPHHPRQPGNEAGNNSNL